MWGAVIGDIAGSRFEGSRGGPKDFELFHRDCAYTDDTVCTAAVADIVLNDREPDATLQRWCRRHPGRGYGGYFSAWIASAAPAPYGSFGNGAAMRVAPVALVYRRSPLDEALSASDQVTEITHDHPEGIKGARAVTEAIWLALRGEGPDGIRCQITKRYGYDLDRSVEAIRPSHRFDVTCHGTVPTALVCALESTSLEDAVRNAVSLGGDADTLAAIAGAVGEAVHGVRDELVQTARGRYLNDARDITAMLDALYERGARETTPETDAAVGQRAGSPAWARPLDREQARATCQSSQSAPPDQWGSRVMQVVREVRTSIGEVGRELPDEFRPAHLSVALVDAVFNPQLHYYRQVVPIVERYCDRFRLKRLRDSDDRVPPRDAQEPLAELVRHYEELGLRRMREEVFRGNYCSPGTRVRKSDNVLHCARALRGIGIETLQDVSEQPTRKIKGTLRRIRGIGERTVHMLLMYCGDDEFVKGDVHVCRFVCRALGVARIEPEEAERLVAGAAREIGVPPRVLDVRIWEHGAHAVSRS